MICPSIKAQITTDIRIIEEKSDLQAAAVLRQHFREDRLGTPVFVGGVEGCHSVFCQWDLRLQYPC